MKTIKQNIKRWKSSPSDKKILKKEKLKYENRTKKQTLCIKISFLVKH